nr:hypothetical protein PJ912_01085 [Pectobacterium colocasium]
MRVPAAAKGYRFHFEFGKVGSAEGGQGGSKSVRGQLVTHSQPGVGQRRGVADFAGG